MASISVANFITQYLRLALPNVTDFTDAMLGYWIDAALLDISRGFPRKTYATWDATTGLNSYAYSDSETIADETTIIRVLTCFYPWVSDADPGDVLTRKSHLDDDFLGGNYYEPDNEFQILHVGSTVKTGGTIYADCHIVWKVATANIINPPEHYELIRLFCIWQAFNHQASDVASSTVPDSSLLNALALEARRAEIAYRSAYSLLSEAKAISGVAKGWVLDKWDKGTG